MHAARVVFTRRKNFYLSQIPSMKFMTLPHRPHQHLPSRSSVRLSFCPLLLFFCFGTWATSTVQAQQAPTPTFSDQIGGLALRAGQLIPALQSEVINQIGLWFEKWAFVIAPCIMLMAFIRVWHETSGGGTPMIFYFVRVFLVLVMLGVAIPVLQEMNDAGRVIAYGDEMKGKNGESLLNEFYLAQRESFDTSYKLFTQGVFTVKVDGKDFTVKPTVDTKNGTETLLGVLYDSQSTVRDFNSRFSDSSWSMPLMFSWLNIARGIIDFGDLWLIGLSGILVLVMKACAPIMVAVAVDQKLAHKITYPYTWGCVVLMLVWPSVSLFIRGIAFMFGNVLMALGDTNELYNWNDATLNAIRDPLFAQPLYTTGLVALMMTVAGVCVWFTPVLAYRFSMGQIYEGVSQIAASTVGGIIGAGVEWYSANIAGHIQQQAGTVSATGSYQATSAEATANRQAGMLRNQAGYVSGKASALSSAQTQAGMAAAAGRAGVSQAYLMMGSSVHGHQGYNERMIIASKDREISSNNNQSAFSRNNILIGGAETSSRLGAEARGAFLDGVGGTANLGAGVGYRTGRQASLGDFGGGGSAGLNAMPSVMSGYKIENTQSLEARIGGLNQQRVAAQEGLRKQSNAVAGDYADKNVTINRETGDQMAHISRTQAAESSAAAWGGYHTALKGQGEALSLNNKATNVEFSGRMEGAGINRDAAIQAAKLQALASVVSAVGNRVAREIEDDFELRY